MTAIKIFTLNELGINKNRFISKIKDHYSFYEYDEYLYRQTLINKLVEHGIVNFRVHYKPIEEFYVNGSGYLIDKLKQHQEIACSIKKYRKRMILSVLVNRNGEIHRELCEEFSQDKANVVDGVFDFRLYSRTFKEAPDSVLDDDTFKIIGHFTDFIFQWNVDVNTVRVIVHYTIIEADTCRVNSNSPEGIHQDGMDYIISALVIERKNINGGTSSIYYPDYKNKILDIELQEGMGIFQPDINTSLWHEVNSIHVDDKRYPGFRSTIGFDFEIIR